MKIQINQELTVMTDVPFLTIIDFKMEWEVNKHAQLCMKGLLDSGQDINRFAYDSVVKVMWNEEILFSGIILEEERAWGGITTVTVKAASASIKLDAKICCHVYQNIEKSFSDIAKKLVEEAGGNIINATEKKNIEKPVICYQETAWEFIKRLASHHNSCVVVDVFTGKPNIWFGLRKGDAIKGNLSDEKIAIEVEKSYRKNGQAECVKKCYLESKRKYSLGDNVSLQGEQYYVYKQQVIFERGALRFLHSLSNRVKITEYYNKAFMGLGLNGVVKDIQNEMVRISFDIGEEEGEYYYPWRPETGNVLYEMPEKGAKVMLYFKDYDEREGVAFRCAGQPIEEYEIEDKVNVTPNNGKIQLSNSHISIAMGEESYTLHDKNQISFWGDSIEIKGKGNVRVKARGIHLSASSEIKVITEI